MESQNKNYSVICEPRSFKLAFKNGTPNNILEINQEILESVEKYAIKAVVAYTKSGRAVTFEELAKNGVSDDLPEDGSEITKALTFELLDDKLFVLETMSATPLTRLKLNIAYRRKVLEEEGTKEASEAESQDPKLKVEDDYTANMFVKVNEASVEKV